MQLSLAGTMRQQEDIFVRNFLLFFFSKSWYMSTQDNYKN